MVKLSKHTEWKFYIILYPKTMFIFSAWKFWYVSICITCNGILAWRRTENWTHYVTGTEHFESSLLYWNRKFWKFITSLEQNILKIHYFTETEHFEKFITLLEQNILKIRYFTRTFRNFFQIFIYFFTYHIKFLFFAHT